MQTPRINTQAAGLGVILLLAFVTGVLAAPTITSELDRQEINMGEAAELTVTISGGEGSNAPSPSVPGLEFVSTGQSSQFQFINGQTSSTITYTFEVVPQHAGVFNIPPILAGGNAVTLRVLGQDGSTSPARSPDPNNLPNPNIHGSNEPHHPTNSTNEIGFTRLVLPKTEFYVGEKVPVEVKLLVRGQLAGNIRGLELPTLEGGDAFALNKLPEKPEQTQENINGQLYLALTFRSALTALKPGDFGVTLQGPINILVRENQQIQNSLPPGFDDPMFQNLLGLGRVVQKRIILKDDPDKLTVLPLPMEGRPADFTGAVGAYTASAELSDAKANFGDPVTLRLKIIGSGDFDRVSSGMVASNSSWKTYKPTAKFTPSDSVGFGGEKDFEQAVIPLNPGSQTIPALSFSYFNPETRSYETNQTSPLTLEVGQPPVGVSQPATAINPPEPVATARPPTSEWRNDHVVTEGQRSSLRPLYYQSWFLGGQAGLIFAFAGVWAWSNHREQEAGDERKIRLRQTTGAVNRFLGEMQEAVKMQDSVRFFAAARATLQQQLSLRWKLAPGAITLGEVSVHFPDPHHPVCQIFSLADQIAYSGQIMSADDLAQWATVVRAELKKLS